MNVPRRVVELYAKGFLAIGGICGLLMGMICALCIGLITNSAVTAIAIGIGAGVVMGAIGIIVSFVLVTTHILGIMSKGYQLTDETLGHVHLRKLVLVAPYDETYDAVLSSIESIAKKWIIRHSRGTGRIEAYISGPLTNHTQISFDIRHRYGLTVVNILSTPAIKPAIDLGVNLDFGRSLLLADKVVDMIKEKLRLRWEKNKDLF